MRSLTGSQPRSQPECGYVRTRSILLVPDTSTGFHVYKLPLLATAVVFGGRYSTAEGPSLPRWTVLNSCSDYLCYVGMMGHEIWVRFPNSCGVTLVRLSVVSPRAWCSEKDVRDMCHVFLQFPNRGVVTPRRIPHTASQWLTDNKGLGWHEWICWTPFIKWTAYFKISSLVVWKYAQHTWRSTEKEHTQYIVRTPDSFSTKPQKCTIARMVRSRRKNCSKYESWRRSLRFCPTTTSWHQRVAPTMTCFGDPPGIYTKVCTSGSSTGSWFFEILL